MLEKTLESPLDSKEVQAVHSKGDQSCVFFGRTNAKAETPILWPSHAKSWLRGQYPDAGGFRGRRRRGRQRMRVSPTRWTWVWVNSRSWWWTGKPSVLHSMELQSRTRLRDWTELLSSKESTEAMTPEIRMHASSSSPSFCWQLSVKKPTLERPLGWACKSREIFFNLINSRKY